MRCDLGHLDHIQVHCEDLRFFSPSLFTAQNESSSPSSKDIPSLLTRLSTSVCTSARTPPKRKRIASAPRLPRTSRVAKSALALFTSQSASTLAAPSRFRSTKPQAPATRWLRRAPPPASRSFGTTPRWRERTSTGSRRRCGGTRGGSRVVGEGDRVAAVGRASGAEQDFEEEFEGG